MIFDVERKGTGTNEWAEFTENICIGCSNNCRYCYAAHMASTMYGGWCRRGDWSNERFNNRANIKSYPIRNGVVMFPSTHDITPFNVDAYVRVATLILEKGNRLLIVSKPRVVCIKHLVGELEPFREQILFRFTVGNMDASVTDFWEPGAPPPLERLHCLALAQENGFKTSVSIEPMLGGHSSTLEVVNCVKPFVTETIWVGKMNKIRTRVDMNDPKALEWVQAIEDQQCDSAILGLYRDLKNDPKIRWKDSVMDVVNRLG